MVFCFSSSYRLTRVLCFVLFLADFGRAHVGGSYRTCVCSLKSLNKKVSESRPRLKQACCTRTLRGPFESFIFLCMHCFYVCKREKMGEEIVCKVCKSQFFSLLLHFIPSYYPKTNKQKKRRHPSFLLLPLVLLCSTTTRLCFSLCFLPLCLSPA